MNKTDQLLEIRHFRDGLKKYFEICNRFWEARNRYSSPDDTTIREEEKLREDLTEKYGRLEVLFNRMGTPTRAVVPAIGVPYSIFDEALSADFERRSKGDCLEQAISSATKAIGLFEALSESDYRGLQRATPVVFIGHSFAEVHREKVNAIKEFTATFPLSVITGEKPATEEISEKIKKLIDDSDFIMAILTKDNELSGGQMTPSKWVSDEVAYAMGKNKKIIRLVEDGLLYEAALSADAEYIQFSSENPYTAFAKLSQVLNGLLEK